MRIFLWIVALLAVFVGLVFGYYHFILDWEGRPYCHKQIRLAFDRWMNGSSNSNTFPNVDGRSTDSLAVINDEMNGHMHWAKDYKYVPGLREDDPGDLVLMYFNRPTRWKWHGCPRNIFKEKAWIVVPVDFTLGNRRHYSALGELNECISTEEFKKRLQGTLAFVQTNARPHWETVVAEHTKYLELIEHANR